MEKLEDLISLAFKLVAVETSVVTCVIVSLLGDSSMALTLLQNEGWFVLTKIYVCPMQGTTIMRTHCNPTEFCSVVSNFSPAKIRAVNDLGFGYLQELKMEFMHDPIWMSMVNGVDLKNSSVVICGVQYSLTAGQFTRCTGITDGIFDVVIRPEPFQVGNGYMGSYLFDNDGKLERSNLVDVIRNREEADDLFKIMYTLYAVNTIICPGTDSEFIDTSIMNSITRATRIRDLNWASYAISVLIDGVQKHRRGETQVVAGCMLFMELLYLDILGEAMDMVDKTLVPVSAWRTEDADEVVRQVKLNGGFGSPLVMVKQRERLKTLSEFVNNDGTVGIGINRAVHEDIYELKAKVCSTHRRMGGIVNLLEEFLANFYDTRDLLVDIEKRIARHEEDNRVKEVWTGPDCKFNARKRGSYSAAGHNEYPKRTCSGQPSLLAGTNKPHCAKRLWVMFRILLQLCACFD